MMPWGHLLVGYIGCSLFLHAIYRTSPTTQETLVVGLASLLPDLIDKPLAWEFGVFASGYAIGHSVLFGVPVSVAVGWLTSYYRRPRVGWAFAISYLLHPVADIVPKYLLDGEVRLELLLWPFGGGESAYETGFRGEFTSNVLEYGHWLSDQVTSGSPDSYLFVVLGIGLFGIVLWVYDGLPVGREVFHAVRRTGQACYRAVSRD